METRLSVFFSIPCGHESPFIQHYHCVNSWIPRSLVGTSLSMKDPSSLFCSFFLNLVFFDDKLFWTFIDIWIVGSALILLFSHPLQLFLILCILSSSGSLSLLLVLITAPHLFFLTCRSHSSRLDTHRLLQQADLCTTHQPVLLFHCLCWWLSVLPTKSDNRMLLAKLLSHLRNISLLPHSSQGLSSFLAGFGLTVTLLACLFGLAPAPANNPTTSSHFYTDNFSLCKLKSYHASALLRRHKGIP